MPNWKNLLVSILLHLAAAFPFVLPPAGGDRSPDFGGGPPLDAGIIVETELVRTTEQVELPPPVVQPELDESQDKPPTEATGAIEFAGEPRSNAAEEAVASEPRETAEPAEERPRGIALAEQLALAAESPEPPESPEPLERNDSAEPAEADSRRDSPLPVAEGAATNGVDSPEFHAVQLTLEEMEWIVAAGQGAFVVFCGEQEYLVRGRLRRPNSVDVATPRELHGLSSRALPVAAEHGFAIREQLRWNFAVRDRELASARVRLVLGNPLDRLILRRQQEAVARAGRSLEEAAATIGRFRFKDALVADFAIEQVLWRHRGESPAGREN